MADKIKAFPQPNHYLIFQAIIELIVSISRVSSCSRLSPSPERWQKKGSACPSRPGRDERAGAGPGQGAVRRRSAETGQWRAGGRPSEGCRTRRLPARPATAAGALPSAATGRARRLSPGRQRDRQARPGPRLRGGKRRAGRDAGPFPTRWCGTHSVGRAPRSGLSWKGTAG